MLFTKTQDEPLNAELQEEKLPRDIIVILNVIFTEHLSVSTSMTTI